MTPDFLVPVDEPCPVVHLEWDRGHESFDAIVRIESVESMIVTVVHDLWPLAGCKWIRADEVVSAEPLAPDSVAVRVLDHLGVRMFGVDPALSDLRRLFMQAADTATLLGIYSSTTGSDGVLVGTVRTITESQVILDEVSPRGVQTVEDLVYEFDEVISVEWGTDYLRALGLLLSEA